MSEVQNPLRFRYYISCFGVVVAFTSLISTAYVFFTGNVFYIAVIVCFLLAFCCVITWLKVERAIYVKESLQEILDRLSKKADAEGISQLVEIVDYFGMQDDVANAIEQMISTKPDPTERYWLYMALGKIGGKRAKSILDKSHTDHNTFAQNAVAEAQELLDKTKRSNKRQNGLLGRYCVREYILAGMTLLLCVIIAAAAIYRKNLISKSSNTKQTQNNTSMEAIPETEKFRSQYRSY